MQARAAKSNASNKLSPENIRIEDVNLIPNPVIPRTPTIREAQRIIDAIVAICWPEKIEAFASLVIVFLKLNLRLMSVNNKKNAEKMAKAAANCGV